jgi:hypothetical protein
MGKKIAKQVATASRNDPAPILRVFFELLSLERVNLVANDVPLQRQRQRRRAKTERRPPERRGGRYKANGSGAENAAV